MFEFLYLIQDKNDMGTNIYKIGKTTQGISDRLKGYPRGTRPIRISQVDNCDKRETELINIFKTKYLLSRGREYFEGQLNSMIKDFTNFCDSIKVLPNNLNNNTTNNNTTNNIIINITPYNDPNLEGVEKYYLMALKKLFLSVPTIIEKIHFNTSIPENHNICITNYRSKVAKVFNGQEWKTMNEDAVITELVNTYETLLEDCAEDDTEKMKYIDRYKQIKRRDGETKVMNDIKDEVKKLIYDKRSMIKLKN